jgi:MFS family permease
VQFGACLGSVLGLGPLAAAVNAYGYQSSLLAIGFFTLLLAVVYWVVIRNGNSQLLFGFPENHESQWKKLGIVLRESQVWWVAIAGFCCWVPAATFGALWGVPYLMKAYDLSNVQAGWLCSLFWIGVGVGSPFVGWLSDAIQLRKMPFYLCFGLGLIGGLMIVYAPYLSIAWVTLGILLIGFSASIQSLTFGVIKDFLPADRFATASGFVNMAAIIGGAGAQLLFGILLTFHAQTPAEGALPVYDMINYQVAMSLLPLVMVVGLAVTKLAIKETHCRQLPESSVVELL